MNLSISLQQGGQFPRVESFRQAVVAAFDDLGEEAALVVLQLQHFLLDGVVGDEAVDEDRFVLADTVGAVDGLAFGLLEFWNSSTSFIRCGKGVSPVSSVVEF